MKEKTLRVLEFNKVKDILRKYAITESGKRLVDELSPYKSIYIIIEI